MCLQSSSTELLQRVCEVVDKGLEALAKAVATMLPQDRSAIIDSAYMQVVRFNLYITPSGRFGFVLGSQ